MLIRFAVENFLSFKKRVEFTMGASKILRHKDHIAKANDERLLKISLIYGANASGKTNLVRAINVAKRIILRGIDSFAFEKNYFRLDKNSKSEPCVFQFDIFANGHFYSYGFAINHTDRTVIEEWLYCTSQNKCIFLRSFDGTNTIIELAEDLSIEEKNKLSTYAEGLSTLNMRSSLFLTEIFNRSDNVSAYSHYHNVRTWFSDLIIIFPNSVLKSTYQNPCDKDTQTHFGKLLEHFDTGIIELKSEPKDLDKAFSNIPESLRNEIKTDLLQNLSDRGAANPKARAAMGAGKSRLSIKFVDGGLVAEELLMNHGNNDDLFSLEDESDGTRRLFDLIPILFEAHNNKVIIVDELDRSFHTKLSKEFLCIFLKNCKNKFSQLIATTHDSNLLDLDFVRQDEIWFVERDCNHSSVLIPLDKFKVRFDKDIEKDYLLGRYGAIPLFNNCQDEDGLCECSKI